MNSKIVAVVAMAFASVVRADFAPISVNGLTFAGIISSGSGIFASYGGFKVTTTSSSYTITPFTTSVLASSGIYTYAKTGPNTAQLYQKDAITGIVATTVVAFSSAYEATFSTGAPGWGGQVGTFILEGPNHQLTNISTRAQVGTGANILIAGFVIEGSQPMQLLFRGVGPTLASFGLSGTLPSTSLGLYDSTSTLIVSNTGWGSGLTIGPTSVIATVRQATASDMNSVGAFALPSGSADSAMVATLPTGNYTVEVSGNNSATGVGLVEVYLMQ
jgi:hypothetical protein